MRFLTVNIPAYIQLLCSSQKDRFKQQEGFSAGFPQILREEVKGRCLLVVIGW